MALLQVTGHVAFIDLANKNRAHSLVLRSFECIVSKNVTHVRHGGTMLVWRSKVSQLRTLTFNEVLQCLFRHHCTALEVLHAQQTLSYHTFAVFWKHFHNPLVQVNDLQSITRVIA